MADIKLGTGGPIVQAGAVGGSSTTVSQIAGGSPAKVEEMSSADQTSIIGNGLARNPLRDAGGGGGVDVDEDGSPVVDTATILNFIGDGVSVADAGAGQANITINGGGSSPSLDGIEVLVLANGAPIDETLRTTIFTYGGGDGPYVLALGAGVVDGQYKTIEVQALQGLTGHNRQVTITASGINYVLTPDELFGETTFGAVTLLWSDDQAAWSLAGPPTNFAVASDTLGTQVVVDPGINPGPGGNITGSGVAFDGLKWRLVSEAYDTGNTDIEPRIDIAFMTGDDDEGTLALTLADYDATEDAHQMTLSVTGDSEGGIQVTVAHLRANASGVIQFESGSDPSGGTIVWNPDKQWWDIANLTNATVL